MNEGSNFHGENIAKLTFQAVALMCALMLEMLSGVCCSERMK